MREGPTFGTPQAKRVCRATASHGAAGGTPKIDTAITTRAHPNNTNLHSSSLLLDPTKASLSGSTHAVSPTAALHAVGWGGLVAGVLDALDAVVAYGLLGRTPVQVLQYVASGLLGPSSFQGGLVTAALGTVLHFFIAFAVAAVFVFAARRLPVLVERPTAAGLAYGAAVYLTMNYAVLPFSAVPASPFFLPLFLNGILGHAIFVGLPIAWSARRVAARA